MLELTLAGSLSPSIWLWHYLRRNRREATILRQVSNRPLVAPNILAHEIRTSLSLAVGAAELPDGEDVGLLTPTQQQFVDIIMSSSRIVIDMVRDFLYSARLQARLFELRL